MRGILENLSLKAKLLGGIGVFLLLVGVFLFVFFPQRQKAEMERYVNDKAIGLAQVLAKGSSMAVVFEDVKSAKTTIQGIDGLPGVVFACTLKRNDSTLAAFEGDQLEARRPLLRELFSADSACVVHVDGVAIAMAPIRYGDKKVGSFVVGLDLTTLYADVSQSRWITLSVSMGILVLGLVFLSIVIRHIVVTPVSRVRDALQNADLNLRFNSASHDEIGQMTRAFDSFVESLQLILRQVGATAESVANASAEIAASAESMASGTQEQSSQARDVVSGVEEMAKTIMANSQHAAEAAQVANKAKEAAEQGGGVVDESVSGMRRIAEVVKQSAQTVQALGASSDQIGEIIGVIDDIADQTNLLALNAAIEAARAGEQGRGFAVVADEVRKLAERTTKATKEIAQMIRKIQVDTRGAVSAMEEGTKQADEGIRLGDKAGKSLREIVGISQLLTGKVTQIAAATEQQSRASQQISQNVEAISLVTGETAEGTQQIARSVGDLMTLAGKLRELLKTFKLELSEPAPEVHNKPTSVEHSGNIHRPVHSAGRARKPAWVEGEELG